MSKYNVGDIVEHIRLGRGTVVEVELDYYDGSMPVRVQWDNGDESWPQDKDITVVESKSTDSYILWVPSSKEPPTKTFSLAAANLVAEKIALETGEVVYVAKLVGEAKVETKVTIADFNG